MAIYLFTGLQGDGKTYSMMDYALREFRHDPRQVYSNMVGLKCPEAKFIMALQEFCTVGSGLCFLDEIGIFMSSRRFQRLSDDNIAAISQVRKHGLDVICSSQRQMNVDPMIRDNCQAIITCRRIGKYILHFYHHPNDKKPYRRRVIRMDPKIFALYDTLEVIGATGSGVGSGYEGDKVAMARYARRRDADEHTRRAARRVGRAEIWQRDQLGLSLTKEARTAYEWLRAKGHHVGEGLQCAEAIRTEVERRRFLADWHLGPDDVEQTCCRERPWLEGYDPKSVAIRCEAEENLKNMQEEIVKNAAKSVLARSKGRARLSVA